MPTSVILRVSVLLLVSSFFAANTQAQRDNDVMAPGSLFEISGQVRSGDNKTAENILIRIETHAGALVDEGTTDSMGRFRFTRLRAGQYRVSAKAGNATAPAQFVDLSRSSPRIHVLLELKTESPAFVSRERPGVIDVRVPVEARNHVEKGRAAVAENKSAEAISHFKRAVEIFPDFYDAHMSLAQLYIDGSQWDKAEATLRQALKILPKSVEAMVSLGEVYRRQKRYSEGEKVLDEALKINNNSWQGNFTLGRIHWELKDIVRAGKYVARTIELQPNVAEAHLLAGNIFIRAGLPENALIEYQEYLRLAPNGEFAAQTQTLIEKIKKSLPPK
ncbi:MAG TPA: tetratricopeptide repeat protein [Pyrinomonadaceae bacterium]|nr:tetratricopeptide repeat protein [Pyrinomonadaceae bacterium]